MNRDTDEKGFAMWFGDVARRVLLVCFSVCAVGLISHFLPQAVWAWLPLEPMLRIDAGMHTAPIRRIAVDSEEKRVATVSDDKTVRLWDLESGNLLKRLSVPSDNGEDGMLYAVAFARDGKTLATGGLTGVRLGGGYSIYLFDLRAGTIVKRLGDLPGVVCHIDFSEDGRFMAVSMRKGGIRVYDTGSWMSRFEDSEYGEGAYWVEFGPGGELAASCMDGSIRLYSRDFRLIARKSPPGGSKPFGLSFSPDGMRIAVGFDDSTMVNVLSAKDLSPLYAPDVKGMDNGNLRAVAWSADGERLYAGGSWRDFDRDENLVRVWQSQGQGGVTDIPVSKDTIMQVVGLRGGRVLYCSADPSFGCIGTDRRLHALHPSPKADFRNNRSGFLVSGDGSAVVFGTLKGGGESMRFSIETRILSAVPQGEESGTAGLRPPDTGGSEPSTRDWRNSRNPMVRGVSLKLETNEICRSLAFTPDRTAFLSGSDWNLRLFDLAGHERWKTPLPGAAWGVNVSGDGKLAVACLGDGTVRWFRLLDGKEILALFPCRSTGRWILWTPTGYYACSAGADEIIGWQLNLALDKSPDFFPASRFGATYYRPDIIEEIFKTQDESVALARVNAKAGIEESSPAPTPDKILPPVVAILFPQDGTAVSDNRATIKYEVRTSSEAPVTGVKVLVDGRPLPGSKAIRRNTDREEDTQVHEIPVVLPERDCALSVIAENEHAASEPASVRLKWTGNQPKENKALSSKPRLVILAIGVADYKEPALRLNFAAKDAVDFCAVLKRQQETGVYGEIVTKVLIDGEADKKGILEGLEWLKSQATENSTVMLFISGHGFKGVKGAYYFVPQDLDLRNREGTGVPGQTIWNAVQDLPSNVIYFVDTCHSGSAMHLTRDAFPDVDRLVNELKVPERGIVVFASSTGMQESQEHPSWGNGAFTKALVEGLSGKAALFEKNYITTDMLGAYLTEQVKELTGGKQSPTIGKPSTVPAIIIASKLPGQPGTGALSGLRFGGPFAGILLAPSTLPIPPAVSEPVGLYRLRVRPSWVMTSK